MCKQRRGGWNEWLLLAGGALLLLAALTLPLTAALAQPLTAEERQLISAYENDEIIRLHVMANSDSPRDQTTKLAVRDALIDHFGSLLAQASDIGSEEAYQVLQSHLPAIQRTAQECAKKLGFEGSVTAEAGRLWLPERAYGQVVLPEGEYRALRVTLGSGEGKNWWCVLFPQLCLSLSSDGAEPSATALRWNSQRIFAYWLLRGQ